MNRRFAVLQAVFSLIALGAVVLWASHQDTPEIPSSAESIAWIAGSLLLVRARHRGSRRALAPHPRAHGGEGLAGRLLLPERGRLHGQQRAARARRRGAARSAHGRPHARRKAHASPARSSPSASSTRSSWARCSWSWSTASCSGDVLPTDRPLLIAGGLVVALLAALVGVSILRRRGALTQVRDFARPLLASARAIKGRPGVPLLGATVVALVPRGRRLPGGRPRGGAGHQRHRRALPRGPHELRGRAARRPGLDRHVRCRRGLRRQGARGAPGRS